MSLFGSGIGRLASKIGFLASKIGILAFKIGFCSVQNRFSSDLGLQLRILMGLGVDFGWILVAPGLEIELFSW